MPPQLTELFKRPRRMLTDIKWKETSGVDFPANQEEGWLVMKQAGIADELEEILKTEAEFVEKQERLYAVLAAIEWDKAPYSDAPDDVKAASKTLQDWLEAEGHAEPKEGKKPSDYSYAEPAKKVEDEDVNKAEAESEEPYGKPSKKTEDKEKEYPIPRKKLIQALYEAVRQVFSRRKPIGISLESAKIIKSGWGGFLEDAFGILRSPEDSELKKVKLGSLVEAFKNQTINLSKGG